MAINLQQTTLCSQSDIAQYRATAKRIFNKMFHLPQDQITLCCIGGGTVLQCIDDQSDIDISIVCSQPSIKKGGYCEFNNKHYSFLSAPNWHEYQRLLC